MICSMTGFGRGVVERGGLRATVELSTVNNRYLDINVRLPRGMGAWEPLLREQVRGALNRGKVTCTVNWERSKDAEPTVALNAPNAERYAELIRQLQDSHGVDVSIDPVRFLQLPEVLALDRWEDDEETGAVLTEATQLAVSELVRMREAEGGQIATDLRQRVEAIRASAAEARTKAVDHPAAIREKLQARIAELFGDTGFDPQRLAEEVAYYAEKADITEECVRLDIHLGHVGETLASGGEIGRRLNFLLQEINREVNTIGSKTADMAITSLVVAMKEEAEKIREQVQNLE